MTRKRLPLQQDLITDVWRISNTRQDVELLLEHIVRLQSQAIALAEAYGAKQTELATLAQTSRQRIGQIIKETDVTGILPSTLRHQVDQVTEWPQDTMSDLRKLRSPRDQDDPGRREVMRKQTAVVYGQDEADRRHESRSAFLASLATDPDGRATIQRETERARRRVFGTDANEAETRPVVTRPIAIAEPAAVPAECAGGVCGKCARCTAEA